MPVIKSAMKRVRTIKSATARNHSKISAMRTSIKNFEAAVQQGAENAEELLNEAYSKIDRTKSKGLIKKNNASGKKARLARLLSEKKNTK